MANDFEGKCWTQEIQWPKDVDPAQWGITCLKADTQAGGLSTEQGKVHTGKNSGYAAVNLAYLLGAERILLLGFDMKMRGDSRHWFGAHPEGMEVQSNYASFVAQFKTVDPQRYGIEIWNVSRDTALDCFPRYDLKDVYSRLVKK